MATLIAYLTLWPTGLKPQAWYPQEAPKLEGKFALNDILSNIEIFGSEMGEGPYEKIVYRYGTGPEDVAVDKNGNTYSGYHGGLIRKFDKNGKFIKIIANTGGRPLGLALDNIGNLIVADANNGLLKIDGQGKVITLTTESEGLPLGFTDDLDIASDGKIYFSDASYKHTYPNSYEDVMEHSANGRLLVFDPNTEKTKTLLEDLYFANGVALSPQEDFVLVNETNEYRVTKYWIKGIKKGTSEIFIDNLPGFPDNISVGQNDIFWIALYGPRMEIADYLADKPFLRNILFRLPESTRPLPPNYSFVIGVNSEGKVIYNLQNPSPDSFSPITSVKESDDYLYFGSLLYDGFGRMKKSKLPTN